MSNEQKNTWFRLGFCFGDYITQFCGDYNKPLICSSFFDLILWFLLWLNKPRFSEFCLFGLVVSPMLTHLGWVGGWWYGRTLEFQSNNLNQTVTLGFQNGIYSRKLICSLKRGHFKRTVVFQPSFFRGYVSFQGCRTKISSTFKSPKSIVD